MGMIAKWWNRPLYRPTDSGEIGWNPAYPMRQSWLKVLASSLRRALAR
jgi:hypothetical protein